MDLLTIIDSNENIYAKLPTDKPHARKTPADDSSETYTDECPTTTPDESGDITPAPIPPASLTDDTSSGFDASSKASEQLITASSIYELEISDHPTKLSHFEAESQANTLSEASSTSTTTLKPKPSAMDHITTYFDKIYHALAIDEKSAARITKKLTKNRSHLFACLTEYEQWACKVESGQGKFNALQMKVKSDRRALMKVSEKRRQSESKLFQLHKRKERLREELKDIDAKMTDNHLRRDEYGEQIEYLSQSIRKHNDEAAALQIRVQDEQGKMNIALELAKEAKAEKRRLREGG